MTISKTYFNVVTEPGHFYITSSKNKPSSLACLNKIEHVLEKDLPYSINRQDAYSHFSRHMILDQLKLIARSIKRGYLGKAFALNSVSRFCFSKEGAVLASYKRIKRYISPAPTLSIPGSEKAMPFEVVIAILNHLPPKSLGIFAQVNWSAKKYSDYTLRDQLRQFNFTISTISEAKMIQIALHKGFNEIKSSSVFNEVHPCFANQNCDALSALKKFRALPLSEEYDKTLSTLIFFSIENNRLDVVTTLIAMGVDCDIKSDDKEQLNPLSKVTSMGKLDMVDIFLRGGANPNHSPFPLFYAIANNSISLVKRLIEGGANVNKIVRHIKAKKRNRNQRSLRYLSPLDLAIKKGNFELICYLLEKGADPNPQDRDERHSVIPPLTRVARKNDLKLAKMLLERGANPNALSWGGINGALKMAILHANLELFNLLLDYGAAATIQHVGYYDISLLHYAVKKDLCEFVELLLQNGADPSVPNGFGYLPSQIAVSTGIRKLLEPQITPLFF